MLDKNFPTSLIEKLKVRIYFAGNTADVIIPWVRMRLLVEVAGPDEAGKQIVREQLLSPYPLVAVNPGARLSFEADPDTGSQRKN